MPIAVIDAMAHALGANTRTYTEHNQEFTEYTFTDGTAVTYGRE